MTRHYYGVLYPYGIGMANYPDVKGKQPNRVFRFDDPLDLATWVAEEDPDGGERVKMQASSAPIVRVLKRPHLYPWTEDRLLVDGQHVRVLVATFWDLAKPGVAKR